jgi:hypothetical protein
VLLLGALLVLVGCSSPPEQAIVNDAAEGLGGAEKVLAVNTLVIEGTGENTNLGQSLSPDALNVFTVTQAKKSIDFATNRWRLEQTRVATFGPPNPQPQIQNQGVDGDVAGGLPEAAQALDSIATLAANLNRVIEGFGKEGGGESLASSVGAFRSIVSQIQDGRGLLHSLIYDEYTGGGVGSIERSLARFENILREIDQGEGILHSLIYDAPTEQDLVIEALEAGARLNSILAKIDRGEGTLGMIVNDPTLYEDLKLLVGGANRSAVVRGMIRSLADDKE